MGSANLFFPTTGSPATQAPKKDDLAKFVLKARILGEKGRPSPHSPIPDPCDITYATDPGLSLQLISMHTTFISTDDIMSTDIPKQGDLIVVQLEGSPNTKYNLQFGYYIGLKESQVAGVSNQAAFNINCSALDFDGLSSNPLGGTSVFIGGISCGDTTPAPSDWAQTTLYEVVSKRGKSKKYTDVLPLDGGTIGIAHFAAGGLEALYETMGNTLTRKYFNRTVEQLKKFSRSKNNCKGSTQRGKNDNGTGCYSVDWWREGMEKFTKSTDTKYIQEKAWIDSKATPSSEKSKVLGKWKTGRQFAIAVGVSNSLGVNGFVALANKVGWDSEKVLAGYVAGLTRPKASESLKKHWGRRAAAINSTWPCKNNLSAAPAGSTTTNIPATTSTGNVTDEEFQ